MRVLVCGDRNYTDKVKLWSVLDMLRDFFNFDIVIEGEARGADKESRAWAEYHGLTVMKFPANWDEHGKAAGPIRNTQMLKEGQPDLVVAFHKDIKSSKGTFNMITQANKAGIPVYLYGGNY